MKDKKILSAKQIIELTSQQYANTKSIQALCGGCGKAKALEIKNIIRQKLENEGYYLPANLIPMDKLVDYLKINISYYQRVANNEK